MAQFKAFSSGIEVNGETVLSVVQGMGAFRAVAVSLLKEQGIEEPAPGRWYSQQAWLDAFEAISAKVGAQTLYAIGKQIPENAQFPPEINSLEAALQAIDVAYHMNHKSLGAPLFDLKTGKMREGIGHYQYEAAGDRKIKMTCHNPYPCDFDRGIIEAMAKRFKPAGAVLVKVKHDDTAPCRKTGADSCTYWVEW